MINILITENRSSDPVRFFRNRVRVFVCKDYDYGFWVDEDRLFSLLDLDQKKEYLTEKEGSLDLQVTREVAEDIVNIGFTPYPHKKQALLNRIKANSQK